MTLPPGVSQSAFDAAISAWRNALGAEHVYADPADVALYRDPYSPFLGTDRELVASAAVAPANVEQVQALVRIANQNGVPLYPVSTGRNLGYGGAAPPLSGSVVVDLKRMNRIIEVNPRDAYAILEPGVSFIELGQYLQENNIPLMVSAAENGAGGPVGNALDRGIGGMGDNFGRVCGMEVVLPNGELLRTGSGATDNPHLWPLYRYGYGAVVDGLFAQANFGIVTKMGFWLEPQPERFQSFSVTSPAAEDFPALVDAIQGLRHAGTIFYSSAFSPIRMANNATVGQRARGIAGVNELLASPGGGSDAQWSVLARQAGLPGAMVGGKVKGPRRVVEATLDYLREYFARFPGTSFTPGRAFDFPLDPETVPVQERVSLGFPNLWGFQRLTNQAPNRGHYYFAPNIRATAEDMLAFNLAMREAIAAFGAPDVLERWGWVGGLSSFPKTYTALYDFIVTDDRALNERNVRLFEHLVKVAAGHGWAEYRAPGAFQDLVASVYDYNDNVLRRFAESMKDAVDPNGILAPGRGGIWPERFRGMRR